MSLVEKSFILCPFLGGSTIRGFTVVTLVAICSRWSGVTSFQGPKCYTHLEKMKRWGSLRTSTASLLIKYLTELNFIQPCNKLRPSFLATCSLLSPCYQLLFVEKLTQP